MKPEDYNIREQYLRFNNLFFEGKLPSELRLGFANLGNYSVRGIKHALGVFRPDTYNPNNSLIELDTMLDYTQAGYDATLLHEMVHAWNYIIEGARWNDQSSAHGSQFWSKLTEVDTMARSYGIQIPATEDNTYASNAEGKRRSSMTLAIFNSKGDDPRIKRYSYMLPSVFDEIVNNFAFKIPTRIEKEDDNARTRVTKAYSGSDFYKEHIKKLKQFSNVDWDKGVEIYKITDGALALKFAQHDYPASQRFLDGHRWVTDTPNLKFKYNKWMPRSKTYKPAELQVYYSPELYGMLNHAIAHAVGAAVVRSDGVYVNGNIIHHAPLDTSTPVQKDNKTYFGSGEYKTTKDGLLVSKRVSTSSLTYDFFKAPDGIEFSAIIFDRHLCVIDTRTFKHGAIPNASNYVIMYIYDPNDSDKYFKYKPAGDLFNMLPYETRSKVDAIDRAELCLDCVRDNEDNFGIYNKLALMKTADALERGLKLPANFIMSHLANLGKHTPIVVWDKLITAIGSAKSENRVALYKYLMEGKTPVRRNVSVSSDNIDATSFMEDVFGVYGNISSVYDGFVLAHSNLGFYFPWNDYLEKLYDTNPIRKGTLLTSPTKVLEHINKKCIEFEDKSLKEDPANGPIIAFADAIQQYSHTFRIGSFIKESERYKDTLDTLKSNLAINLGVLNIHRLNTIRSALIVIINNGLPSQKEIASKLKNSLDFDIVQYTQRELIYIDFKKFVSDLGSLYAFTQLFTFENPYTDYTELPANTEFRNYSIALWLLGGYDSQMPMVYHEDAYNMWDRINDTANGGPMSVIPEGDKNDALSSEELAVMEAFAAAVRIQPAQLNSGMSLGALVIYAEGMLDGYSNTELTRIVKSLDAKKYMFFVEGGNPPFARLADKGRYWVTDFLKNNPVKRTDTNPVIVDDSPTDPMAVTNCPIGIRGERLMDTFDTSPDYMNSGIIPLAAVYSNIKFTHHSDVPALVKEAIELKLVRREATMTNVDETLILTKFGRMFMEARGRYFDYLFSEPASYAHPLDYYVGKGYKPVPDSETYQNVPPRFAQMRKTARDLGVKWDDLRVARIGEPDDYYYQLVFNVKESDFKEEPKPQRYGFLLRPVHSSSIPKDVSILSTSPDPKFATYGTAVLSRRLTKEEEDHFDLVYIGPALDTNTDKVEEPQPQPEPIPEPSPTITEEEKPEPEPEPEPQHEEQVPERQVIAPKVKVADGKTTMNISIGVNERTKKLMFVPVEKAESNNIGIVRKREAKPVTAFLNYVFSDELADITKKIRAKQRKTAARDLARIANRIRPYLLATGRTASPFPNKLGEIVEKDWGEGLSGQKAFWHFLQGKTTTKKKIYSNKETLIKYAGILDERMHKDDEEEASVEVSSPLKTIASKLSALANKYSNRHYQIKFVEGYDQATWRLDTNLKPVIMLPISEITSALKNMSEKELAKFLFDPLYGVLEHEYNEAILSLALITGNRDVIKKYPNKKLHKREVEMLDRFKLTEKEVKQKLANAEDWGKYEGICGLAHDLIISPDEKGYYRYIKSLYYKLYLENAATKTEGTYAAFTFDAVTKVRLHRWLVENKIPKAIKASSIHSTLIYSRKPLKTPWEPAVYKSGLKISPSTYSFEVWDDNGKKVLVLKFDNAKMQERFALARKLGATWDYPSYKPHVTLSYDVGDYDISSLKLPKFSLVIDKEYTEPLQTGWGETADFD